MRGTVIAMCAAAVSAAACGGGAPEEVPESRWAHRVYAETRPAYGEEWAAQCQLADTRIIQSGCTDDPVVAQQWAEAGQAHYGDSVDCTSTDVDECLVPSDDDVGVVNLPADQ